MQRIMIVIICLPGLLIEDADAQVVGWQPDAAFTILLPPFVADDDAF